MAVGLASMARDSQYRRMLKPFAVVGLTLAIAVAATGSGAAERAQKSLTETERACLAAAAPPGSAESVVIRSHAIAMHGTPKYGPDFTHFDYADPDAPKGGSMRVAAEGSFDSFNPYIAKGDPANPGVYETLMIASNDEAFSKYGLLAETIEYPEDRSWVAFHLRPEARWHDGKPVTADDVVFSFNTLREKGAPFYRFYFGSVEAVEKTGPLSVKFSFGDRSNQELPLILGQLPVLPKHWWEGRDFSNTHLDPPLGSGPYKLGDFEPGRYYERVRVEDYWGRDLPVMRGHANIDRIRTDYFRDRIAIREAVKSGIVDLTSENQAKAWAVDWDTPAVNDGRLIKDLIPVKTPAGMQSFAMNARKPKFQDIRVRRALGYAFDFEWTNRTLFYGQYDRTDSFFDNSELAAEGPATGEERAILECLTAHLPETVLDAPDKAVTTDGSGWPRANLREAFKLLFEAGYEVRDLKMVNAKTGRPFRFEFLIWSASFERIILPYKRNLERLGIDVRVRLVDQSEYINRLRQFDYDMIVGSWGQSESPGNEQRDYWGSESASRAGSRNLIGIANPAIDALIEVLIEAPDRESLIARTRALDRALLSGHWVVPNWHISAQRLVYWDIFGKPEVSSYKGADISTWWIEPEKAAGLQRGRSS